MQDWPLVRDCRAHSAVRYSFRDRCWWSVCDGAIRFICSLWHGGPPHSSAAPGALLWHNWFGTSMIPSLIWMAIANSSELFHLLRLSRWFCVAYHAHRPVLGPILFLLYITDLLLLMAMVSDLICMQMTPKSTGSAVRLQRWSFRTASLPASMMWPGRCAPTGSSWILQRPRFSGLHPVDAFLFYTRVTHLSGYRPSHPRFRCPQPRHLHGRWCVDEVARLKDSSCLFCDSASTSEYSSLSSTLHSSVVGFIPRSAAAGLR